MNKEYTILANMSARTLEIKVMEYLNNDWILTGGVAIETFPNGQSIFYQALYRTTKRVDVDE